tara:strand:+ start:228 stop:1580 length:1353 start_codon:yes stop_codon:yes gene_type:complete
MKLFILFLLVVKSYATCPDGQFYLVEFKESGTCTTHISKDTCQGINSGNFLSIINPTATYSYRVSSNYGYSYLQYGTRDMTSWYPRGCQIQTNLGQYEQGSLDQIRYADTAGTPHEAQYGNFDGACDNGMHNEQNPATPCTSYPCPSDMSKNQGGTNCLCAPPGETDAICVSECPAGKGRRNDDTVTWDSCDAIVGCMDESAMNYDPTANKEDPDSCTYCQYDQGYFWLVSMDTSGQNDCDIGAAMCQAMMTPDPLNPDRDNQLEMNINKYSTPKFCHVSPGYNTNIPSTIYNPATEAYVFNDNSVAQYRTCGPITEYTPQKCGNTNPDGSCSGAPIVPAIPLTETGYKCICPPTGHSEPQCVNICPLREDGSRGYRAYPDSRFDDCSREIPGCIDPLYLEYTPEATMNTPYITTTEDGSKFIDPRACQTLSCETVSTLYDNQCLPEGQC